MTKKKKLMLVAVMPAILTVIVIGGVLAFVLIAGSAGAPVGR